MAKNFFLILINMTSSKRIRLCKHLTKTEFEQKRSNKNINQNEEKQFQNNEEKHYSKRRNNPLKHFLWISKLFRLRTLQKEIEIRSNVKIIIINEEEYNKKDPFYYKNADILSVFKSKKKIFLICIYFFIL